MKCTYFHNCGFIEIPFVMIAPENIWLIYRYMYYTLIKNHFRRIISKSNPK